jgi:hypothetical protein
MFFIDAIPPKPNKDASGVYLALLGVSLWSFYFWILLAHSPSLWHNTNDMTSRYMYFALSIIIGVALGLVYGWVISPVQFVDTSPDMLRIDYKADYVLMVSEAYSYDDDLLKAVQRLAQLGSDDLPSLVEEAIILAVENGYQPEDLALMRQLYEAVRTWNPVLETGQ